jgi:hypothetical protein
MSLISVYLVFAFFLSFLLHHETALPKEGGRRIKCPPRLGRQCGRTAKVPESAQAPRPRLDEARVRTQVPHIEEAWCRVETSPY